MATPPNKSPIDSMNEYKGSAFPSPGIPLLGFSLGITVPYVMVTYEVVTVTSAAHGSSPEALVAVLQSFGYVGILFAAEFFLGAAARSTSAKASFSPAAAAAIGRNPFAVVQSNRIHQNHIESFCILAPTALAAAAACGSPHSRGDTVVWVQAAVLSWVGFRVLYRYGYCNSRNPMWRIVGTAASMTQSIICFYFWGQHSFASK